MQDVGVAGVLRKLDRSLFRVAMTRVVRRSGKLRLRAQAHQLPAN
jgi:hypothetical protein